MKTTPAGSALRAASSSGGYAFVATVTPKDRQGTRPKRNEAKARAKARAQKAARKAQRR